MKISSIIFSIFIVYILLGVLGFNIFKYEYSVGKFKNSRLYYIPQKEGFIVGKDSLVNLVKVFKGEEIESFFFTILKVITFFITIWLLSAAGFGIAGWILGRYFNGIFPFLLALLIIILIAVFGYGFEALFGLGEEIIGEDIVDTVNLTNITNNTLKPVVSLI